MFSASQTFTGLSRWRRTLQSPKQFVSASGQGHENGHQGELIQGPVLYKGRVTTAVVTLLRPDRYSIANVVLTHFGDQCWPDQADKAGRAVTEVIARVSQQVKLDRNCGFDLTLSSNIRPGSGQGSSTADVLATINATLTALGLSWSPEAIQRLCWKIEGASDPICLARHSTLLYGSRCGTLIERWTQPLNNLVCLGFDTNSETVVPTAELVGREGYTQSELDSFEKIIECCSNGIRFRDSRSIGKAATASGQLNQHRLPTRHFGELCRIAAWVGAVGVSVSHSGTVGSLLFDPRLGRIKKAMEEASIALVAIGCDDVAPFIPALKTQWGPPQHKLVEQMPDRFGATFTHR